MHKLKQAAGLMLIVAAILSFSATAFAQSAPYTKRVRIDIFDDKLPEEILRKVAEKSGIKTEGLSRDEVEKALFTSMAKELNIDVTGLDTKQIKEKVKAYVGEHREELKQKFKRNKDKKQLNLPKAS